MALLPFPPRELKVLTELEDLIPSRKVLPMGLALPREKVSDDSLRSFSEFAFRESFRDGLCSDLPESELWLRDFLLPLR